MASILALVLPAIAAALLDQGSKVLVRRHLEANRPRAIIGPLALKRTEAAHAGYLRLSTRFLVTVWICCVAVLLLISSRGLPMLRAIGMGTLTGAAASNLFDRVTRGGVLDFIAIRGWRTFNVADALMVAALPLIWSVLL